LYSAFPVESCLEQRINENLNAEIASGTIHNIADCVGYLSWTYYARRVKKNPMYYGAESSNPEHVEDRILDFVKESIETLRSQGCIDILDLDEFAEIAPTTLGIAASQYYLSHRTPKQMQVGIREGRKIILKTMKSEIVNMDTSKPTRLVGIAHQFIRSKHIDEPSIAWLLFALCSTHEFDELPVRHNEEHLNEDLSHDVMWGPDVLDILSGNKGPRKHRNVEIYLDPHTKAFLLVQASLEQTKLPISDYVNDTKSVMENLPRILAAMSYIAAAECDVEGSFELLTQFSRTRQLLAARCKVDDDPILQLPGFKNTNVLERITNLRHDSNQNEVATTLLDFRLLQRKEADEQIRSLLQHGVRQRKDDALNMLYNIPQIQLTEATINFDVDKVTKKSIGKLSVSIDIERTNPRLNNSKERNDNSFTLTLLLGSWNQRLLLANNSPIRISRFGKWTIHKELTFDWEKANADGGQQGNKKVILRLLMDEVRGLDLEVFISLNCQKRPN
jgi:replicative superfamily II helicase